jgi:hypothetical protein
VLHVSLLFYNSSSVFKHKSLIHHVLKIDEVTDFKRIGKTIIQVVEKPVEGPEKATRGG